MSHPQKKPLCRLQVQNTLKMQWVNIATRTLQKKKEKKQTLSPTTITIAIAKK